MAFAGIFIAIMAIAVFLTIFICMMASFIIAAIIKRSYQKSENKRKKILSDIFMTTGIILAVPIISVIILTVFHIRNEKITLPDKETEYISANLVKNMINLLTTEGEISITDLEEYLQKEPNLIYYFDTNRQNIIDYGLKKGNVEVVKLALSYGAVFDSPARYDYIAYTCSSMDSYLDEIIKRKITDDDVEIIKLMFENNASTDIYTSGGTMYSNALGKAVWSVLYNDETVTDIELEFIQVFIDNGLSTDTAFILYENRPHNVNFSSDYCFNVIKDDNYHTLTGIVEN